MASASDIYVKLQKLSNEATKKTLDYNKQEAASARSWQQMMSDTSHQREVKDLIAAGLNPVLSSNQGAQSYTTSAASGQAENAANAVANAYGADRSAAATKAAAASSAAATRYAANQNLKAAQAAAYANMYAADKHYESQKYQTDNSKSGSVPGIVSNVIKSVFGKDAANTIVKHTKDFFSSNKYKIIPSGSYSWLNLTRSGKNKVDNGIKALGVNPTMYTRNLYIQGILNDKKSYANKFNQYLITVSKARSNSARFFRSGPGIW